MSAFWIVTANAGRARFFAQQDSSSSLEKIGEIINDKSSLHTADTESDRIGQHAASSSNHSVGAPTQPSGYQPNQSPAEHYTELFARDVSRFLLHGYQDGNFQRLVLIASPEFLGVLRKVLHDRLVSVISTEINKDYTHCSVDELAEHIHSHAVA
ncbi:MAG TPA: host attachment protein [Cellvibrionaceae bacterium]